MLAFQARYTLNVLKTSVSEYFQMLLFITVPDWHSLVYLVRTVCTVERRTKNEVVPTENCTSAGGSYSLAANCEDDDDERD
jgi:hypothetical protein